MIPAYGHSGVKKMRSRVFAHCLAAALLISLAGAAETAVSDPGPRGAPPHENPDRGKMFRYGPGMWQAFSQLSPKEREELQKLQREDPVKFREVMAQKAEALYKQRQARIRELEALAAKCREAGDPAEAERLRAQLTAEVEKDFREHLAANRRHLEDMKRRAKWMEKELDRREKRCAEAVKARVDALIRGEKMPFPPHHPGRDGKNDGKPLEK